MSPGPQVKPGPHWWKANALTTAPSLLPLPLSVLFDVVERLGRFHRLQLMWWTAKTKTIFVHVTSLPLFRISMSFDQQQLMLRFNSFLKIERAGL